MKKHYDVIIAGGGPSGIAAALAAKRYGIDVLLIEKCGFLGGVAASGLPFLDFFNNNNSQVIKGIAEEFYQNLLENGGCLDHKFPSKGHMNSITFIDPNWVKIISEEMLLKLNCDLLYHSFVYDVEVNNKKVNAVKVANKGGSSTITADCFVDCTGDGDLAAFSGVGFEKGRPSDGLMQAMTTIFSLINVDLNKIGELWNDIPISSKTLNNNDKFNIHLSTRLFEYEDILKEMKLFKDSGHHVWAGTLRDNELTYVNTVRVSKLDPTNPVELTQAEIEGRRQIKKIISFFNNHISGLENAHLGSIAAQIGIRESRRIKGEYTLTGEDILTGKKFDDAISKFGYCIDIHDPEGEGWNAEFIEADDQTYDIPYRCLVPKKIDSLLVAGRCISSTHEALASTRIMSSCMALGQAAGTAAALSSLNKLQPRELDVDKLRKELRSNNAIV